MSSPAMTEERQLLALSDQLSLQLVGHGTQPWKEMAVHRLERHALAVNADVQCGDDSAVEPLQWNRDRPKTDLGLLVGERVAVLARLEDGSAQLALVDDGGCRDPLRRNAGEKFIQ